MPSAGWWTLLRQAKRSFWLLFGGIWLVAGVTLFLVGIGMAIEERRWADAIETTGMVLTKVIVPADSDSSTEYRVTFRYVDERGQTREGDQKVEVATWEALTERGPVDVFHLRDSSEQARLDPRPAVVGAAIFLIAGFVTGSVGGILAGRALRDLARARRLLSTGVSVEATVTAVEPTDVSYNQRPQYRVRYAYRAADGSTYPGDSGYLEWDEASGYSAGDPVAIRYDPKRPSESVWIGRPAPSGDDIDAAAAEPTVDASRPR